jgi:uncharacterized damage-inducible protein DinB
VANRFIYRVMMDEVFIRSLLQKGREAKEKVNSELSGTSLMQLNWKPLPGSWSIGQCLDHLVVSESSYFSILKKVIDGTYKMNFWERHSPFSAICARILKDQLQEKVKRKLKAPKKFHPSRSELKMEVIERYHQNLDGFLELISNCQKIDIDKIILTSPAIRIVTYSLRDALYFLIQHEHRHINQAIRVKSNENFPRQ